MKIAAPLNSDPVPILQWIEVSSTMQIPGFHIVGLANQEVNEARERVRSAIDASDLKFPKKRVVMNLSPASVRKRGTGIDLAMALGVLTESYEEDLRETTIVAWGELGLDGSVKPAGQLTRAVYAAWKAQTAMLLVSDLEADQARRALGWLEQARELPGKPPEIVAVSNLGEAWEIANGNSTRRTTPRLCANVEDSPAAPPPGGLLPLSPSFERLIGVAAAGRHHILLLGPRGAGKSHALEWLIALQPRISASMFVQQLLLAELSQGAVPEPIRRIGAMVRPAALVGSASNGLIHPGEFSMAHGGLLVADELPEWSRDSRECLREPMERGKITLTRKQGTVELPAGFTLAANGNLCPCGGWPQEIKPPFEETSSKKLPSCECDSVSRRRYLTRMSGPVLDRIDIIQLMLGKSKSELRDCRRRGDGDEILTKMRAQVDATYQRAVELWGKPPGLFTSTEAEAFCGKIPPEIRLSNLRARHKLVRLALTLSCWDGATEPTPAHFTEAALYRPEQLKITA